MATIVITGANRGIGLELARQYAERSDQVIGVCRRAGSDLRALGVEVIEGVDVTADDSVAELASALRERQVDRLVNNAGVLDRDSLEALDYEAIERQFRVNAVGPLRVTAALRDRLAPDGKVFIVTSRMGSIDDNTSGGYYGYRMSKAAVNMAAKSLSIDLRDRGIGVFVLHPGMVSTAMTNHQGIDPAQAARGLIERMDTLDIGQSGSFWHQEGYELPW